MPCTWTFRYLAHKCTKEEDDECTVKCKPKKCCACIVVCCATYKCVEYDLFGDEYSWGGSIDVNGCLCKTKRPPRRVRKARRRAFNREKKEIKKEWERIHERPWPKDKDGRAYDAHHITEIQYGGSNDVTNIFPVPEGDHTNIHRAYRRAMANC
jgi:hypothetical protein